VRGTREAGAQLPRAGRDRRARESSLAVEGQNSQEGARVGIRYCMRGHCDLCRVSALPNVRFGFSVATTYARPDTRGGSRSGTRHGARRGMARAMATRRVLSAPPRGRVCRPEDALLLGGSGSPPSCPPVRPAVKITYLLHFDILSDFVSARKRKALPERRDQHLHQTHPRTHLSICRAEFYFRKALVRKASTTSTRQCLANHHACNRLSRVPVGALHQERLHALKLHL
jgi:hypothetical protein